MEEKVTRRDLIEVVDVLFESFGVGSAQREQLRLKIKEKLKPKRVDPDGGDPNE